MKKLFFLLLIMLPALATAQGHKGEVDECAPMKNGKVCYRDTVHVKDMSQDQIFEVINQWAKKSYAKDIFLSNVNSKKSKGTINVSSKVEMLLNDTDKTIIKYKMKINCHDNCYSAHVRNNLNTNQPHNKKKNKTYTPQSVNANGCSERCGTVA